MWKDTTTKYSIIICTYSLESCGLLENTKSGISLSSLPFNRLQNKNNNAYCYYYYCIYTIQYTLYRRYVIYYTVYRVCGSFEIITWHFSFLITISSCRVSVVRMNNVPAPVGIKESITVVVIIYVSTWPFTLDPTLYYYYII